MFSEEKLYTSISEMETIQIRNKFNYFTLHLYVPTKIQNNPQF